MGGFGSGRKPTTQSSGEEFLSQIHLARLEANWIDFLNFMSQPDDAPLPQKKTRLYNFFAGIYQSMIGRGPGCPPSGKAQEIGAKYLLGAPPQNVHMQISRSPDETKRIVLDGILKALETGESKPQ
jgi:hypothetical protein